MKIITQIVLLFCSISMMGQAPDSVNTGAYSNDPSADNAKEAFTKLNAYDKYLNSRIDSYDIGIIDVVRDFDAVGDGLTDNSTVFQRALDSASSQGKELIIPQGHYRVDSEIQVHTFDRTHPCIIKGIGSVKLDFSNMASATSGFELYSNWDDTYTDLTENPSKGDTLIVSSLASEVIRGDVLEILSTDTWGRTVGIYKREMVQVRRTSSDTIFLYTPLYDDYTDSTTGVANLNAAVLRIENIEMVGNPNIEGQNAFTLNTFKNIDLRNITIQDFHSTGS